MDDGPAMTAPAMSTPRGSVTAVGLRIDRQFK